MHPHTPRVGIIQNQHNSNACTPPASRRPERGAAARSALARRRAAQGFRAGHGSWTSEKWSAKPTPRSSSSVRPRSCGTPITPLP